MGDLWSSALEAILARARSQMGQPPLDPTEGFDNPPVVPQLSTVPPWTLRVGGNETTLSLPANKGANFEAFGRYSFNPFSPQDFRLNQLGLRYRYEF